MPSESEFPRDFPFDLPMHLPFHYPCKERKRPRLYEVIDIYPSSSQEDINKAAKWKRIESHPDKLKRKKGLSPNELAEIDSRAMEVGRAADTLSDPALRSQYDSKVAMGMAE